MADGSDRSMVRLRGVHLKLASAAGEVNILRGIDLEIAAGETVSIVGPSGSGKSSLMMVIAGLERPTEGRVTVAGQDLTGMGEDALARFRRDRLGIVFQSFHLIPTMSALENVAVPLELAGRADAFARAGQALEAVGLGHRLAHYPGQLSGGEQQRLAVACGVVGGPALVVADEPTAELDTAAAERVLTAMEDLAASGVGFVISSHDPRVMAIADGFVRLDHGRVVAA
jgi:putative ABC transport system ATP-binding protein